MPGIGTIRGRMAAIRVTQQELAIAMGYERSAITRYLTGVRPMPEGFEARMHATLDLLERAEYAAAEARARVLAEGAEWE